MRRIIIVAAIVLGATVLTADAQWGIYAVSNSSVPAGGYLLDGSAGFVLAPYPGKILAR